MRYGGNGFSERQARVKFKGPLAFCNGGVKFVGIEANPAKYGMRPGVILVQIDCPP